MYFGDHLPAHFHAEYGGMQAIFRIEDASLIAGSLPPRAHGLVTEWAILRRDELLEAWTHAVNLEPIQSIKPL